MELPAKYSSGRVQKACEYNFVSNPGIRCHSNIGASTYRRSGLLSAATETTLSDIDARTSYDIFLMQGLRIVSDRIPYKVVFNGIPPRRYASAQPNTAAKRKILISSPTDNDRNTQLHLYLYLTIRMDLLLLTSGRCIDLVSLEISAVLSIIGMRLMRCESACSHNSKFSGSRRHPVLVECRYNLFLRCRYPLKWASMYPVLDVK
jgi:hypothetical protein